MGISELEKKIEDKVAKGEMSCGLYDTGFSYVYVYLDSANGDAVMFKWFENSRDIGRYID